MPSLTGSLTESLPECANGTSSNHPLDKQTNEKIIFQTRQDAAVWPTSNWNPGRLQIGAAGGFKLECMAGFPKPSSAVPS